MPTPSDWFDDITVLSELPYDQLINKLRELDDTDAANAIEAAIHWSPRPSSQVQMGSLFSPQYKSYVHAAHAFGYIPLKSSGKEPYNIEDVGNITADQSLKKSRINIKLDRLRAANYPGKGTHNILLDFYAQNQTAINTQHLHFNAVYRVREGEAAAIIGYPIFIGLNVGSEGVAFKCFTVNVKNEEDEAFLSFLETDIFTSGLKLVNTVQPALEPLSQMALAITKTLAKRHRNVPVQDFYLGLDFGSNLPGARLVEGSYVVVQIPQMDELIWDWREWMYDSVRGHVVNKGHPTELIPYNYLIFSVSRYEGD